MGKICIESVSPNFIFNDSNLIRCLHEEYGNEFDTDTVEFINFENENIKCLGGVERLTNLKRISLKGNQIQEFILHAPNDISYIDLSFNDLKTVDIRNLIPPLDKSVSCTCDFRKNPGLQRITLNKYFQENPARLTLLKDESVVLDYSRG